MMRGMGLFECVWVCFTREDDAMRWIDGDDFDLWSGIRVTRLGISPARVYHKVLQGLENNDARLILSINDMIESTIKAKNCNYGQLFVFQFFSVLFLISTLFYFIYSFINLFSLGEIGYTTTLENPRWNKDDVCMFYPVGSPQHRVQSNEVIGWWADHPLNAASGDDLRWNSNSNFSRLANVTCKARDKGQ